MRSLSPCIHRFLRAGFSRVPSIAGCGSSAISLPAGIASPLPSVFGCVTPKNLRSHSWQRYGRILTSRSSVASKNPRRGDRRTLCPLHLGQIIFPITLLSRPNSRSQPEPRTAPVFMVNLDVDSTSRVVRCAFQKSDGVDRHIERRENRSSRSKKRREGLASFMTSSSKSYECQYERATMTARVTCPRNKSNRNPRSRLVQNQPQHRTEAFF